MTTQETLSLNYLDSLPSAWGADLLPEIRSNLKRSSAKIIILDDDPTGTQTVRDLPVLTQWSVEAITAELLSEFCAFFILTNSRALPEHNAVLLAREIGTNIRSAAMATGIKVRVISRSDSTLRGHFPAEVDALAQAMNKRDLPYLLAPFFLEGGRYTLDDIHYVREGNELIPAALTPFAADAVFGFSQSYLPRWTEEKTKGKVSARDVVSISLDDIRVGGPQRVAEVLRSVSGGQACIVNAASYRDMEVVVLALQQIEDENKEFLYRSAASFVRTRVGLAPHGELLSKDELISDSSHGGLFVIGSYVQKTSRQIEALFEKSDMHPVEIRVEALLDPVLRESEISRVTDAAVENLMGGTDVAVFTSRQLITSSDSNKNLEIGAIVSKSLIRVVQGIAVQPRYLVAKGGITSSDIATEALGVRRAMVLGQVQPGVPVWKLGDETRYPGMSYIVFPGNVGNHDALVQIQQKLKYAA